MFSAGSILAPKKQKRPRRRVLFAHAGCRGTYDAQAVLGNVDEETFEGDVHRRHGGIVISFWLHLHAVRKYNEYAMARNSGDVVV